VLGGDYLLSKAFSLLAEEGSSDVLRVLANTAVRMTESEILQASGEGDISVWERNYWRIIRDKTADFMGACCECGAILGGADAAMRNALREYGVQLGLAFQVTDDVLDIIGDPELTGKEVGTDLMHGKFTLPVLLALPNLDESCAEEMREMLGKGVLTHLEVRRAAKLIIDSGAVELARQSASDCADKACEYLAQVPASEYRQALESLAGFVIYREA